MFFTRKTAGSSRKKTVPSADDWDASRETEGERVSVSNGEYGEGREWLVQAAQEMHWISLACFLEGMNPADFRLPVEIHTRVAREMQQLGSLEPLEAYACSLEVLSKQTLCREIPHNDEVVNCSREEESHVAG